MTRGVTRFRAALATAQVALSMALLALTGIFVQSFANTVRVDLGVDLDSITLASVTYSRLSGRRVDHPARARIVEALNAIPGVSSVASSSEPLLSPEGEGFSVSMTLVGAEAERQPVTIQAVSPTFFRMFGMELLAGRVYDEVDNDVIMVSQRFAERFGLSRDAVIGRTIEFGLGRFEIIGVVADILYGGATSEVELQAYQPTYQSNSATFYVRSAQPPEGLMNTIRETLARVDPIMQITTLRTMEQQRQENIAIDRFLAGMATALALFATGLAALGLYGVLAYSVAQRSREIGLRIALGAPSGRIRGMVMRQVTRMAVVGVVLGAIAALFLGRATQSLLFGVEGGDPLALAAAATVLVAVTLGAAYVPARRASRLDPMTVLRYE